MKEPEGWAEGEAGSPDPRSAAGKGGLGASVVGESGGDLQRDHAREFAARDRVTHEVQAELGEGVGGLVEGCRARRAQVTCRSAPSGAGQGAESVLAVSLTLVRHAFMKSSRWTVPPVGSWEIWAYSCEQVLSLAV